jgi:glutamate dehydrogenase
MRDPTDAACCAAGAASQPWSSGAPVVIFKSPLMSTVLRSVRYDCISVMTPATTDEPSRVHVFLGLFNESGDSAVGRVPVVRRRIRDVLERAGVRNNSYTGRQLVAALRTLPRDELLEAETGDLVKLATLVANRAERGGIGVFSRLHLNSDFVSVLVYLPSDRLGPETVRQVRDIVAERWPGSLITRESSISDIGLARLHYLITLRPGELVPAPDYRDVEADIAHVTRRWSDDLSDLLLMVSSAATPAERQVESEHEGQRLVRRYERAFPEGYKEDFTASTAVRDVHRLESLPEVDGLAFDLYVPPATDSAARRLKILRTGTHISLARALPMLSHLGLEVLDEHPYEIDRRDGAPAWIYDFGLALPAGITLSPDKSDATVENMLETLRRLWRGDVEQDGFNALVLRAGLNWWQVSILRAYAKYLRQAGTQFSQGYIESTLNQNPAIAGLLIELFETRFDPARVSGTETSDADEVVTSIVEALGGVASLDQDRILRSLLGLIRATLRTNAYQLTTGSSIERAMAFKLDPHLIDGLPEPRPRFEIWVYSPRVEGVHLRFGLVARGGLRWSDRREDFRTEILGLVKAQMVKNAVIVPVGAKGGFVVKRSSAPDGTAPDRETIMTDGIGCYRTFISSLLDVTDNYGTDSNGNQIVVAPQRVRRYDDDDAYLVVAADKGTATFSDIANAIACERGFWLGDAFASGGSVGYDHKAMGITARGAWESVKYHFRERGLDTQTQRFTVVGIGDMSGDVFGNGMLLSEHIELLAAFDHRHIFLDPHPDAAASFAERQRLFELPRSSWADYDSTLISAGGGVYPRTVKSVPITVAVRERLGLPTGTTALSPAELMHAILVAPVDLLWNGGIGTYVKASSESDAQVGDKANDGLRADAIDVRASVIGEGGNLGCTQLGRIEFARNGGAINTDAIDNSAGVDTSDHEVNIKILLDRAVVAGRLAADERNPLLASATDEVGLAVLVDNYEQNVLLGLERRLAAPMVSVYRRLIRELEHTGRLDRAIEFLPSDKEIANREVNGQGLLSPELAVVAAWVKIILTDELEKSDLPEEAWYARALSAYFPASMAERLSDSLGAHPLSREIITTRIVNDMVNRAGTTFVFRAIEETSADAAQIARAYTVAREVFDFESFWTAIESLDNVVPTAAQDAVYFEVRRLVDRATRWLIDVRYPITDLDAEIARFAPAVRALTPKVAGLLLGDERICLQNDTAKLIDVGVPPELAAQTAVGLSAFLLLDVVEIAEATHRPAAEVAELHFALSERFGVDRMLTSITDLPRDDRWSALARAALRHDVYAALAAITTSVLKTTDAELPVVDRMRQWQESNSERVSRARATLTEALGRDKPDLAVLSVALRVMRGLPI